MGSFLLELTEVRSRQAKMWEWMWGGRYNEILQSVFSGFICSEVERRWKDRLSWFQVMSFLCHRYGGIGYERVGSYMKRKMDECGARWDGQDGFLILYIISLCFVQLIRERWRVNQVSDCTCRLVYPPSSSCAWPLRHLSATPREVLRHLSPCMMYLKNNSLDERKQLLFVVWFRKTSLNTNFQTKCVTILLRCQA